MTDVDKLALAAGRAAKEERWHDAERLWEAVHKLAPDHPDALFGLGVHALQRGDAREASVLLAAAHALAPANALALLSLSAAHRELGEETAALEALQSALALNPYNLPALLAKASIFELSAPAAAVAIYANALKVAPPPSHWPKELAGQLFHATRLVEANNSALHMHLLETCAATLGELPFDRTEIWREALSLLAGQSRPYPSECNQICVPRLPAIPFYSRRDFPWLHELEGQTDAIRKEFVQILEEDFCRFVPYIAYKPGEPVNQWRDLNQSKKWSAYHLWRGGQPVYENLERCPETAKALAASPLVMIPGLCPNAMFSVLAPNTHIPPHHGETNARLVAHLPLIIPDRCSLRVGFERREWKIGEVVIFDDTIEHEARNDSDELRAVLIFDVWRPDLSSAERALVGDLVKARRAFAT